MPAWPDGGIIFKFLAFYDDENLLLWQKNLPKKVKFFQNTKWTLKNWLRVLFFMWLAPGIIIVIVVNLHKTPLVLTKGFFSIAPEHREAGLVLHQRSHVWFGSRAQSNKEVFIVILRYAHFKQSDRLFKYFNQSICLKSA